MGLFGLVYAAIMGVGYMGSEISKSAEDDVARKKAQEKGDMYYYAHDGKHLTFNGHKVYECIDGVKDAVTGQLIVDYSMNDKIEELNIKEKNDKAKQEAIIKGNDVYFEEIPLNHWQKKTHYQIPPRMRLVENDMPISNRKSVSATGVYDGHYYNVAEELKFGFKYIYPLTKSEQESRERYNDSPYTWRHYHYVPPTPEQWEELLKPIKEWNTTWVMRDKVLNNPECISKWIYDVYCKKYNIPIGTWEEVLEACHREHPLGWSPRSSYKSLEEFLQIYDI